MTIDTKNKKEYYHLRDRAFISYNFYKKYINQEPPFGKLGLLTYLRTYSRFITKLNRREKWCEVVLRVVEYNIGLDTITPYNELKKEAEQLFDDLFNFRTFLSGRTYWIGGTEVTDKNGSAIFNCTFRQINNISAFSETYYWLLLGAGVGFSVEDKCIKQLPDFENKLKLVHKNYEWKNNDVKNTTLNGEPFSIEDLQISDSNFKQKIYQILKQTHHKNPIIIEVGDSKEGWTATLRLLLTLYSYTFPNSNIPQIVINYDNVRPAGERLKTFGGRASGHEALKLTISKIQKCIETRTQNNRLNSVQVTDIVCFIAEGVVAGGVRRSALIALGDSNDHKFINMKKDLFYDESLSEFRSSRTKSNNSVMIYNKPTYKELEQIVEPIKTNGDPGFVFIGNAQKKRKDVKGGNPCMEIFLDNKQCCNLTSNNLNAFVKKDENDKNYFDYDDFYRAYRLIVRAGSRMTLVNQWHKDWDKIQKRDRLLGVSMTGIMDAFIALGVENNLEWQGKFYRQMRGFARQTADEYHDSLGIARSASITTIKPEGCYESHHLRATENGLLRVDEIGNVNEEGFTNVTSNINTTNKDKISKVYNNGLSEVIKITLNNGREINCTKSHPLSVNNKWVVANNLKVGDILDVELGTYQNKDNFNLETYNIEYQNLQKNELSFPKTTSEELAWWLGAFYANGSVQTGTNKVNAIRLCCQHYDICALFKNLSEKLFGVTANLTKDSTKEMFIVDFRSVDLNKWLELNNLQKTKDFEIPYAIRCSSQNTILSFITGYLDNDGCFKNKTCTITTKNEDFARQLQEVGEAVGLSFSCYKYTRTTTKTIGTYCDLQLSRTFSNNYGIDYVNLHSIKVNLFSRPIEKTDRVRKQPYQIKSIELKDEEVETFDIEVENNHWYWQGCIKSHNSLSQLPTVSSGIHLPYSHQYQRAIRFSTHDPMSEAMKEMGMQPIPENGQGDELYNKNCDTWIFKFPIRTETKIRQIDEPAVLQLERYKTAMQNYIESHNVSITVNVDKNEWNNVIDWLDKNYDYVGGIALLNKFDPEKISHPNLPYQPKTESEIEQMEKNMPALKEEELINKIAFWENEEEEYEIKEDGCSGGACPVR